MSTANRCERPTTGHRSLTTLLDSDGPLPAADLRLVPVPPGGRVVSEALMGDVAECLKGPGVGLDVEQGISAVRDQPGNGGHSLLGREESGLRDAAGRAFTDSGRGIFVHGSEKKLEAC